MSTIESVVLLFDIDGTLIDSAGAGGGALLSALSEVFGISEARPVALHGRTDFGIITELLESHGVEANSWNIQVLCQRYYECLPGMLHRRQGRVLPGVIALLDALRNTECHLGLLTGNMPLSARFKLEHYGLWERFGFGVFGDSVLHRKELSTPAMQLVRNKIGEGLTASRVVIVGDTPMDVELARAMSCRSLAVRTGGFEEQVLLAAGADKVVDDLSDTASILQWCLQACRSFA